MKTLKTDKKISILACALILSLAASSLTTASTWAQNGGGKKPSAAKGGKKAKSGAAGSNKSADSPADTRAAQPSSASTPSTATSAAADFPTSDRVLKFLPEFLYLAASANLGWTYHYTADWQSMPWLFHAGGDVDVAYRFSNFNLSQLAVGLNDSLEFVNQYSANTLGVGNRRGMRWNLISPAVYFFINPQWMVAANLRWLGNYALTQSTATGLDLSYTGVLALRGRAFFTGLMFFDLGAGVEYGRYSQLSVGSIGTRDLSDMMNYWQVSLIAQKRF